MESMEENQSLVWSGGLFFGRNREKTAFDAFNNFRKSTAYTKEFYGLSLLMIAETEKLKIVYFIETELFLYEIIETG